MMVDVKDTRYGEDQQQQGGFAAFLRYTSRHGKISQDQESGNADLSCSSPLRDYYCLIDFSLDSYGCMLSS